LKNQAVGHTIEVQYFRTFLIGAHLMAVSRLDQIRQDLENELEASEAEVGRLKAELAAAEKDHKAIKDAIAALGRKSGPSPKKPTVKKVDVCEALREVLQGLPGPTPKAEVEVSLRERFSSKGFGLTGFALRFKEALEQTDIEETEQGLRLAQTASRS